MPVPSSCGHKRSIIPTAVQQYIEDKKVGRRILTRYGTVSNARVWMGSSTNTSYLVNEGNQEVEARRQLTVEFPESLNDICLLLRN